ncbi:hypothetical protein CKAH01_01426 [Colletotrichum kahawae]|uniref:Uncharacterized protein n=1 Tax=Colletotrichum kahawae TaxID=34407 RepID=A0AAE0D472_COLKA|nr:hypothetical protein CKAH01_01426 [Colletotrichum kahawae]
MHSVVVVVVSPRWHVHNSRPPFVGPSSFSHARGHALMRRRCKHARRRHKSSSNCVVVSIPQHRRTPGPPLTAAAAAAAAIIEQGTPARSYITASGSAFIIVDSFPIVAASICE